jgi:hypothetical protein
VTKTEAKRRRKNAEFGGSKSQTRTPDQAMEKCHNSRTFPFNEKTFLSTHLYFVVKNPRLGISALSEFFAVEFVAFRPGR